MKILKYFLLPIMILSFTVSTSSAQNKSYSLNAVTANENKDIPISKKSISSKFQNAKRLRELVINPVIQNTELIRVNDTILLDLFNDKHYKAYIDKISVDVNGTLSVRSKLADYSYGYCVISTFNGQSFMIVEVPEKDELYLSKYDHQAHQNYLLQIDKSKQKELKEGAPLTAPNDDPSNNKQDNDIRKDSSDLKTNINDPINNENFSKGPVILQDENKQETIAILIVYTPAAASWSRDNETNINNTIGLIMARSQLALDNSSTLLTLQLVHSEQVNYNELNNGGDLDNLTQSGDGFMDNVHSLRNTYCADLVVLLENMDFAGGQGWILSSTEGDPERAFSVNRVQQSSWGYTVIHEIGHNLGCGHHKLQKTQPGPGLFSYSAGWRWTGTDNGKYCSIMTYWTGEEFNDGIDHRTVLYFSNPGIQYQGVSTGDATNGDNARTIRQTKSVVAAYRSGCCSSETLQATSFRSTSITDVTMTIGWTRGNGTSVMVFAREGSAVNVVPMIGTAYVANATFGMGSQLDFGTYIVYNGTGTSVNLTGLTGKTTYHFAVFEYNLGSNCYRTLALTGNATTICTLPPAPMSAITQPTCSAPTGSVVLTNLPATGTWTLTRNPGGIINVGEGTSTTISGLATGKYGFLVTNGKGCTSAPSAEVFIRMIDPGNVPFIKVKWNDVLVCYNLNDSIVSYQWFKDGSAISDATDQYYVTNKQPGVYKVETIDRNGCKNASDPVTTSGTKSVSVYPNPASASFALKIDDDSGGKVVVSILSSAGIKVMGFQVESVNDELLKRIPVDNLDKGIYVIRVLLNQKDLHYSKIIVIK